MPTAGYSQTPLVKKLGIKPGASLAIINPPPDYSTFIAELPFEVDRKQGLSSPLDFVHFFTQSQDDLAATFPSLKQALKPNGMLWISWPKRASKVETDLNENIIREIGLSHGLVDVKVCAVDETWSGLKFVYRLADRP